MNCWLTTALGLVGLVLSLAPAAAAPVRVLDLRTQKVEGITYFQARLERPADLRLPTFDTGKPFSEADRRRFARLPRLTPQDGKARAVYYRHRPAQPGLSFCGLLTGDGKARFILLYPLAGPDPAQPQALADLVRGPGMAEAEVELDFTTAAVVAPPQVDPLDQHLHRDDLRGLWALYQAAHFAALETQVVDFPFYGFAREATARKYNVAAPAWVRPQVGDADHRLYEVTTGADAIAETLQLRRVLQAAPRPAAARTVDLAQVPGVRTPALPWDRLLGGKQPATEPLAALVPEDNYYVHFRDLRKFLDCADLMDQWGTGLLRVYEVKSRDGGLRERYERQLCLKATALARTLSPALVKGIAVTGHDPYVREGTDVTVIFHVANRPLFLAAVAEFLQEARQAHGAALREGKDDYHGTTVESFVTPLREVSLHRAAVGEFVVYSNSPAGVRRVLDAQRGAGKRLADAADFRYLRTLFPLGDGPEDGLVYLSEAFLRQLTGPATRIGEARRLEALTSLHLATNAALFCAWETGRLPPTHEAALAGAGLRPEDVAAPEGRGARWEAGRRLAVADTYNTLHFATPLVELPIDRVTPAEAAAYGRFRQDYEKLWRTYFDPIGLRVALDARRVRVEAHVLPVVASEAYQDLRSLAGQGTFAFVPRADGVLDFRVSMGGGASLGFQLDENASLREMVELLIRWETDPRFDARREYERLFWKLPLGLSVSPPEAIPNGMDALIKVAQQFGLIKDNPIVSQYQGTDLHRLPIVPDKYREMMAVVAPLLDQSGDQSPIHTALVLLPRQEAPANLHLAVINGAIHLSADEGLLKKRIDRAAAKPAEPEREVNAGLMVSPANAGAAAALLLEYEGHSLALLNNEVWNSFYRAGILAPGAGEAARAEAVRGFLGYLPVSPDGSRYRYDTRSGEVVNERHGSLRRPDLHAQPAARSELGLLLEQIKSIRADLRFVENGLHTVVTIERK